MMETFWQDIRYAIRTLLKSRGFTAIALLTLALGIGANTAIFSVINAVLVRALPYEEPERVVWMWGAVRGRSSQASVSPLDFLDYREQNQSFEHLAAAITIPVSSNLTNSGEPERISGAAITTNYFQALGIKPELGRDFLAEEEQAGQGQVVILSHHLWQRRFGGDQAILDQTLTLDGKSYTVIGVMPPAFRFPSNAEMWTPLSFDAYPEMKVRKAHFLRPIGRLKPGVTMQQAQAEMDGIARQLEEKYPDSNTNWGLRLVSLQEQIVGNIKPTLLILLGAVAFVLLIACANVANLLLVRSASRQKEIAIRSALGARRWRIVRQMLTESLLLSSMGGALGVLVAMWCVELLVSFGGQDIPRSAEIKVDWLVLAFTFGVAGLTGILFGIVPALQVSNPNLNETLKEGGRGGGEGAKGNRTRSLLIIAESALAVVLLIGAGLLIKSFIKLQNVDPGFRAGQVLTVRLDLPRTKETKPEQWVNFYDELQRRLSSLPGVEYVGMVSELPLTGQPNDAPFSIAGRVPDAGQTMSADFRRANQDYFQAMGIPLLKGRYFTEQEARQNGSVVIISDLLAEQFFPEEDPLGKQLTFDFIKGKSFEIIGIIGDVHHRSLEGNPYQTIYLPSLSLPWTNVVIRAKGDAASLAPALRKEVAAINPNQPVANVKVMDQWLYEAASTPRFRTILLGIFAAVALLLSIIGIYGVMSYVVTQRTHEIGIRLALGAKNSDILKLVINQGLKLALLGIALGLLAAFGLTRLMSSLLFNVTATDTLIFIVVPVILTGVALLACLAPARRASRVDPMIALRYE
jgi:putative ABC transport system permease protein